MSRLRRILDAVLSRRPSVPLKTPGLQHVTHVCLIVSGTTPSLQPYAIEIHGPTCDGWVRVLTRRKYRRFCFSYEKKPAPTDELG